MADFTEQQVYEALGLGGKSRRSPTLRLGVRRILHRRRTPRPTRRRRQTAPEASKSRKSPPLPRRERSRNRMAERLGRREREAESRTTREPAGNRP